MMAHIGAEGTCNFGTCLMPPEHFTVDPNGGAWEWCSEHFVEVFLHG